MLSLGNCLQSFFTHFKFKEVLWEWRKTGNYVLFLGSTCKFVHNFVLPRKKGSQAMLQDYYLIDINLAMCPKIWALSGARQELCVISLILLCVSIIKPVDWELYSVVRYRSFYQQPLHSNLIFMIHTLSLNKN